MKKKHSGPQIVAKLRKEMFLMPQLYVDSLTSRTSSFDSSVPVVPNLFLCTLTADTNVWKVAGDPLLFRQTQNMKKS
jgi:hypothetical protein